MPECAPVHKSSASVSSMPHKSLRDVLDPTRLKAPEHVALIDDGRTISYKTLGRRVAGVAHSLVAQGIRVGDRVALLLPNEASFLECFFGVVAIGAIVVPMNTRLHPREYVSLLGDCRPSLLIAHGTYGESIALLRSSFPDLTVVVCGGSGLPQGVSDYASWCAECETLPDAQIVPDQPAALLYTSGTTSVPKGVVLSHRNYLADFANVEAVAGLDASSINLQLSPLYHAAAVHTQVHLALGACTILQPKFDPEKVMQAVENYRITYFFCVPTMLYQMLDHPARERYCFASLRTISYGAAAITGARLEQALKVFGTKLLHAYGMTETTSHASILRPEEHLVAVGSIGRGLPGTELRVVDERGADSPPDQIGEIIVRGANVMQGYWERPEESRAALQDGWLHTGDLARRDPRGYVYIVDRKKDMIVSGGVNIYPREAEEVLARHPAVAEVAAYGIPDAVWGEALTATVVLHAGAQVSAADLMVFARHYLSGLKLPKQIDFASNLPRTASGKVQKARLRAAYSQNTSH